MLFRSHVCLDALAAHLDSRTEPGRGWTELNRDYVQAFGPDAATIGPPPGYGPDDSA